MNSKSHPAASDDAASELIALRREVDELRKLVRAKDDFIAIAAHELRNPMTPIVGVAELALIAAQKAEGSCPPRVTLLLERLQKLVHDYIKRATRLLDISRVETGNLQLKPAALDLSELVLAIAERYEAAAAHQSCRLEHNIKPGIGGVWDPLAVEQVVENLVSNALKFGLGKPVGLRLWSERSAVWLEVRDRGIGMSAEQQVRIFGQFEQVITDHQGSGFGIGLWVANRLAVAMNGRISVSSRPGEGSTFTVRLPLSTAATNRTNT